MEVVGYGVLVAVSDEDQRVEPGLDRLVHRVLDQRPVDDRQHFLRTGLGGGEEAGAKARDGENGLPDSFRPVLRDALARNATPVPTLRGRWGESAGRNSGTAPQRRVTSSSGADARTGPA